MNWHEPTQDEIVGNGDHQFLVDILPGIIPHQTAQDGDALLRVGRHGWTWEIRIFVEKGRKKERTFSGFRLGEAETKDAAIGDALAELARLRAEA